MESLIERIAQYGALGLVAAVSIIQLWIIQKQLLKLIKDNTEVTAETRDSIRELRETIRDCQIVHRYDKR